MLSSAHGGRGGGAVDARTGYCATTRSFRSLRPPLPLPPADVPLTFPAYALSLLPCPLPANPALLDAATGEAVSYPAFLSQVRALVAAMRSRAFPLGRGDVAFLLAPARLDVPVLYYGLLAVGVVVSPANPALTAGEVARLVSLSGASVAFAVSSTAAKLPAGLPTVLLDSAHFRSILHNDDQGEKNESSLLAPLDAGVVVSQSATATVQYSSGTTGRVKAAALPHRSFIAMAAGFHAQHVKSRRVNERTLMGAPMFHSMGFFFALNGLAQGLTTVVVTDVATRAGLRGMLEAAERWEVTEIMAAPPVVLGITKGPWRLTSLLRVICGGAPLPGSVAEQFRRRFPHVDLCMGYGSTEAGGISLMIDRDECSRIGSAGRISHNVEAKIVDIVTGEPLSVGQKGELCVRGPSIMTGYVGDNEANAAAFDLEGWLKTGDLCYIDQNGFLFVVDRLKELIKYKAYQVAPAELELVLQSLPEIVDAAVMPYPHEEAGEIPMALVVRQPGSKLTEAKVIEHVAKQVAPYKKVRKVVFVDSIPKSPAGKILRRQLSNHMQSCHVSRL